MAEAENKQNAANAGEQNAAFAIGKQIPTSYANAFQVRILDDLVSISYGVGTRETVNGEQRHAVDVERRIVMRPESAARLADALIRLFKMVQKEAPADSVTSFLPDGEKAQLTDQESQK